MTRSPPPPAINAPVAVLTGSTTTSQSSDLPLRNYLGSSDPAAELSLKKSLAVLSHAASGPKVPDTPNSLAAEYGDERNEETPSAAVITERVFQEYARTRSRSAASNPNHAVNIRGPNPINTPPVARSPPESRSRSLQRIDLNPTTKPLNEREKVQRFLRSMSPPSPTQELLKENRSLHQRIAALQRTEQGLLTDNQELARRLASAQKRHDSRRHKWKEELENRERVFEARIKDLETRLARQEEDIHRVALERSRSRERQREREREREVEGERESALDDRTITSWLTNRAGIWRRWTNYVAHRDPNRVQSGLHHVQLRELCQGVQHFVQLTDKAELPEQLMVPAGFQTAHVLLDGLLANFMVSATIESPFWVFDVLDVNSLELASPSDPRVDTGSPAGFRMDLLLQNIIIAPPPRDSTDIRSPNPMGLVNEALAERQPMRKFPRLITSVQPTTFSPEPATNLFDQMLPSRKSVEGLYETLLSRMSPPSNAVSAIRPLIHPFSVPNGQRNANAWRSSIMKSFCEGGLSAEAGSDGLSEDARILVDARLRYAGRLKDSFLRGPARFLLRELDATDIDRIESKLTEEIDAALRFSCQLWCRRDPPLVQGLPHFANAIIDSSRDDMELCYAQALRFTLPTGRARLAGPPILDFHAGQSVIMVVQPSIRSTKIWTKANVFVAAANPMPIPAAEPEPESPGGASIRAMVDTPISTGTPFFSDGRNEPVIALLPSLTYKGTSPSLVPKPLAISLSQPPKALAT
ncbi:hypothetical protein N0V88_002634 [Collariella sp. IMI 366227]|nr:hypothetical protein N0V88_002634 [Collariella sp. IMI 366227]